MRKMYDSVNAKAIPTDAQMVAGYVDGRYQWSKEDWDRFPHAVKVGIAVLHTTNEGHVLDVEPGNSTPAEAVDWVLMRRHAGVEPTVYCSLSMWQQVKQAFLNRRVTEPHFWIAAWDGHETIPAGAVAHQYKNTPEYDLSVVADYWPGVDEKPEPVTTTSQPSAPMPSGVYLSDAEAKTLYDACGEAMKLLQSVADKLKV